MEFATSTNGGDLSLEIMVQCFAYTHDVKWEMFSSVKHLLFVHKCIGNKCHIYSYTILLQELFSLLVH